MIAGAFTGLSADAGSLFLLVVYPGISPRYLMEMVFFFSSVDLSGWIVPPLPFPLPLGFHFLCCFSSSSSFSLCC